MKREKTTIDYLLENIIVIVSFVVVYMLLTHGTYTILMNFDIFSELSTYARTFYASTLKVAIIFLVFRYVVKNENEKIIRNKKESKVSLFDVSIFLFIGMVIAFTSLLILTYLQDITNTLPKIYYNMGEKFLEGTKMTKLDSIYRFIEAVILVPIIEEFIFRKGVFKYFENRDIKTRSVILVSGISFGLIHILGVSTVLSSAIVGMVFASIYAITKNIIYPIIGHGLINFMSGITPMFRDDSIIVDFESYIEMSIIFEVKGAIIISLILLIITIFISYIKRKAIISSDFKDRFKEIFAGK